MAETTRAKLPYPNDGQDPWYTYFEQFCQAVDAAVYAGWEDRGYMVCGGGQVSWDAGTGELTWDESIEVTSSIVGFLFQFAASTVTLADGEFLYFQTVRAPTNNKTATFVVGTHVPASGSESTKDSIPFAFRRGSVVYFRNGKVIGDGQSLRIFEQPNPGNLTPPVDPTDDGKVAIAAAGDLSYALITDAQISAVADIDVSKLDAGSDGQVIKTVGTTVQWGTDTGLTAPTGAGDVGKVAFAISPSGTNLDYADSIKVVRPGGTQDGLDFGTSITPDSTHRILLPNGAYIVGETNTPGTALWLVATDSSDRVRIGDADHTLMVFSDDATLYASSGGFTFVAHYTSGTGLAHSFLGSSGYVLMQSYDGATLADRYVTLPNTHLKVPNYAEIGSSGPFSASGNIRIDEDWDMMGHFGGSPGTDFLVLGVDDAGAIEIGDSSATGLQVYATGGISVSALSGAGTLSLSSGSTTLLYATTTLTLYSGGSIAMVMDANSSATWPPSAGDVLAYNSGGYVEWIEPSFVSYGTDNQVPVTNSGGDGFDYSSSFTFDGTYLQANGVVLGDDDIYFPVSTSINPAIYQAEATNVSGYHLGVHAQNITVSAGGPFSAGNLNLAAGYVTSDVGSSSGGIITLTVGRYQNTSTLTLLRLGEDLNGEYMSFGSGTLSGGGRFRVGTTWNIWGRDSGSSNGLLFGWASDDLAVGSTVVDSINYQASDATGTHEFYSGANLITTLDYGGSPRMLFPSGQDGLIESAQYMNYKVGTALAHAHIFTHASYGELLRIDSAAGGSVGGQNRILFPESGTFAAHISVANKSSAGNGLHLYIRAANAGGTGSYAGGTLSLIAGTGSNGTTLGGDGGDVNLTAGTGGSGTTPGAHGKLVLRSGGTTIYECYKDASSVPIQSFISGAPRIQGGDGTSGIPLVIRGGEGSTTAGGSLTLSGGDGVTVGGDLIIDSGTGSTIGNVTVKVGGSDAIPLTSNHGWAGASTGYILTKNAAGDARWEAPPSGLSFGTDNQIPYTNSGGTDFDYISTFTFDGSILATPAIGIAAAGYLQVGSPGISTGAIRLENNMYIRATGSSTGTTLIGYASASSTIDIGAIGEPWINSVRMFVSGGLYIGGTGANQRATFINYTTFAFQSLSFGTPGAPSNCQVTIASATGYDGADLTVSAANGGGTGYDGGNLILKPGTRGDTGDANGYVVIEDGISGVLLRLGPTTGSPNDGEVLAWNTSNGEAEWVSTLSPSSGIQLPNNVAVQGENTGGGTFYDLVKMNTSNYVQVGGSPAYTEIWGGGSARMYASATGVLIQPASLAFMQGTAAPTISQQVKTTAGTAATMTIEAQETSYNAVTPVGGKLICQGGDATGAGVGTGGDLELRAGTGVTANGLTKILDGATTVIEVSLANVDVTGEMHVSALNVISPASFSTQQDDYAPTGWSTAQVVRLTTGANSDVTGFSASVTDQVKKIANIGSNNVVLKHDDANSAAANRMLLPGSTDLTLTPNDTITLFYDPTSTRWRAV